MNDRVRARFWRLFSPSAAPRSACADAPPRDAERPRRPRRARAPLALLLGLTLALFSAAAFGQERHNYLAVGEAILDDAGPYYFVSYGDSSNAFAKAAPLAAAMGLDVDYDGARDILIFENGSARVEIDVTRDVRAGLERGEGTLRVDGEPFARAVPSAILIDGTSYVAITPLAEAFGAQVAWFPDARVIEVDVPDPGADEGERIGSPRVGRHDGYTRIAIDLPSGLEARLLVADGSVALVVPGATIEAVDRDVDGGTVRRIYRDVLDGNDALVMVVDHPIDQDGRGYRMGRTAGGVAYVDLGPDVDGEPAAGRAPEPRAPPVAAAAPAPSDRRQVVVIDAGHGGHDPGTVSDWAQEKEIVLAVALRLQERLEAEGIEVILTRDEDHFLTLQQRSTFATTERNVFVSIHANAAPNRSAEGIETWVFGRPLDPGLIDRAIRENGGGEIGEALTAQAAESADIAGDILRETQLNYSVGLADMVQQRMVAATGARDRGVRQNLFYVIRNSRIPAILVELGFVSNPDEGRKLMQEEYRDALADALADGIASFLRGGDDGELARR